jgi:hypothetical protein
MPADMMGDRIPVGKLGWYEAKTVLAISHEAGTWNAKWPGSRGGEVESGRRCGTAVGRDRGGMSRQLAAIVSALTKVTQLTDEFLTPC